MQERTIVISFFSRLSSNTNLWYGIACGQCCCCCCCCGPRATFWHSDIVFAEQFFFSLLLFTTNKRNKRIFPMNSNSKWCKNNFVSHSSHTFSIHTTKKSSTILWTPGKSTNKISKMQPPPRKVSAFFSLFVKLSRCMHVRRESIRITSGPKITTHTKRKTKQCSFCQNAI